MDLFREGQGIVAVGRLPPRTASFEAKQVLAKHDERYMPRELRQGAQGSRASGAATARRRTTKAKPAMIAELGAFALILALAFAIAQVGLSAAGRVRRSSVLAAAGEGAALASFAGVALAFACLIHAFVTSDFSVANVAANSHTEKPLLYKVAGAWGSHEGSMLLWCLALTGYGAAAAIFGRGLPKGLKALMVATQGVLGTVFLAYTVFASNPLLRIASRRWRADRSTRCCRTRRSRSIRRSSTRAMSACRWCSRWPSPP